MLLLIHLVYIIDLLFLIHDLIMIYAMHHFILFCPLFFFGFDIFDFYDLYKILKFLRILVPTKDNILVGHKICVAHVD